MSARVFTAVIYREDDLYVAECPEVGTARAARLKRPSRTSKRPRNSTWRSFRLTPDEFMENCNFRVPTPGTPPPPPPSIL